MKNLKHDRSRRCFLHPTRQELRQLTLKGVMKYCTTRAFDVPTTKRIKTIWTTSQKNETFKTDSRDFRSVPHTNRVPRSLEQPMTPPGYWNITDPIMPTNSLSET